MLGKKEGGRLKFSVIVEEVWLGPGTVQESAIDGASSGGIAVICHSPVISCFE